MTTVDNGRRRQYRQCCPTLRTLQTHHDARFTRRCQPFAVIANFPLNLCCGNIITQHVVSLHNSSTFKSIWSKPNEFIGLIIIKCFCLGLEDSIRPLF